MIKSLKFENKLVPLILQGVKTSTWRLFDDKDLKGNDELSLINRDTGQEFAKAKIISVKEKKLRDIKDLDFDGHEKFESFEKMYETYKGYYGDRVTLESMVKMIKFRLIK